MLKTSFHVRRNTNPKRSKSCRPRIEWMETRTLLSPPTITGLNPTSGSEAGGTSVAITGTNFTGATVVDFGTECRHLTSTWSSTTTIMVDSPAGTGIVDVTVTTPGGTTPTSPADQFTYTAADLAPTVTSHEPDHWSDGRQGYFAG